MITTIAPRIWIHSEIRFNSGHVHAVARMAQALRKRGAEVIILTTDASKEIMTKNGQDFTGVQFVVIPPPITLPALPEKVRSVNAARLKAVIDAFDNPATAPKAIITERPLNAVSSHFLPELATHAHEHGALFLSCLRDITGDIPEDIWPLLNACSDLVMVRDGGSELSDCADHAARFGLSRDNVRYVGTFLSAALMNGLETAPAKEVPEEVVVFVGSAMNDRYAKDKMAIFASSMKAWARNPDLRRYPLHLVLPSDTSQAQREELEHIRSSLPNSAFITFGKTGASSEFFKHCTHCKLLVTTAGTTTVEAAMLGTPMLLLPLAQTSHEQAIRAAKMTETGILLPFHNGKKTYPIFSPEQLSSSADPEATIASFSECMEHAAGQSRRTIRANARRVTDFDGAEHIADLTLRAISTRRRPRAYMASQGQSSHPAYR